MKTKCIGCGEEVLELNKDLCERCFRMKYYNENIKTDKSNDEYLEVIKKINKDDLVLYVVDIFNLNFKIEQLFDNLSKNVILVLTKKDILPKSINEYRIIDYFEDDFLDKIFISSNKNYNLDELYYLIKKYNKTGKVYVVGKTNSGKSTLINKMIKNYSDNNMEITTSYYPSTTLNEIVIKLNDFDLIDTPGIIDNGDIINYVDDKTIKKIVPKKEIKPTTFQIEGLKSIILEDFFRIDIEGYTSATFYHSSAIIPRINSYKNDKFMDFKKHEMTVLPDHDIVINGLAFIKITNKCRVILYTLDDIDIYTRINLI